MLLFIRVVVLVVMVVVIVVVAATVVSQGSHGLVLWSLFVCHGISLSLPLSFESLLLQLSLLLHAPAIFCLVLLTFLGDSVDCSCVVSLVVLVLLP